MIRRLHHVAGRAALDGAGEAPTLDTLGTALATLESAGKLVSAWYLPTDDPGRHLTLSGADVQGWAAAFGSQRVDLVAEAAAPQWNAGLFSGKGGVTFNGTSQCLTGTGNVVNWPDGSQDAWLLAAGSQDDPSSNSTTIFCYGSAGSNARTLIKTFSSSANRVRGSATTNISNAVNSTAPGIFDGAHTAGVVITNSSQNAVAYQDGIAGTPGTRVGALTIVRTRVRLGANATASPSGFWLGSIVAAAILAGAASESDFLALEALMRARLT